MPHNGRIKRFVVEYFCFKFYSEEEDSFNEFIKTIGHNIPNPLFTLVLINRNGEVVDLGTLNIIWKKNILSNMNGSIY